MNAKVAHFPPLYK